MPDLTDLTPLERLALRLSFEAPTRQGRYTSEARIPWETIHELRSELERLGFDWRAGAKFTQELGRKAVKQAYADRARKAEGRSHG